MVKQRAPALPDSPSFQQLWDALGSRLIEAAQERLLYTRVTVTAHRIEIVQSEPIV
jgi:hypothetical protein